MARRKRVEAASSSTSKKTKYEPILAENDNVFSGDICLEIMSYLTGQEIFISCLRINRTWFNIALARFDNYHFKANDYEKATNLLRTIRRNNYSKLYYATMNRSYKVKQETPKLLAEKITTLDLSSSKLDDRRATLLLDVLDMTKNLKVLKLGGTRFKRRANQLYEVLGSKSKVYYFDPKSRCEFRSEYSEYNEDSDDSDSDY